MRLRAKCKPGKCVRSGANDLNALQFLSGTVMNCECVNAKLQKLCEAIRWETNGQKKKFYLVRLQISGSK
jgi:hypothetical protein